MAALDESASVSSKIDGMNLTDSPMFKTVAQRKEFEEHKNYLTTNPRSKATTSRNPTLAPIFTGRVLTELPDDVSSSCQYGLLGAESDSRNVDTRLLLNMTPPWSAFICGSQGSGKSHTMSCMLENALRQSKVANINNPLAGIVFHYDRFTSYGSKQICEAAYLCSQDIPVNVLVSPANYNSMVEAYGNMPGLPEGCKQPKVAKLLLTEDQLDVPKMQSFMGCGKDGELQLYMQTIIGFLRDMAQESGFDKRGIDFYKFQDRIQAEIDSGDLNSGQTGPLKLRMDLLRRFLRSEAASNGHRTNALHSQRPNHQKAQRFGLHNQNSGSGRAGQKKDKLSDATLQTLPVEDEKNLKETWKFRPGSLTIVDLSCPFVDESAACALFIICLQLFLEGRKDVGRIVALDEAHKFLTDTSGAAAFTDELVQVIRQERHLAARVLIATQEPTLSPILLELCRVCIVHRFHSSNWLRVLQAHIGALDPDILAMNDSDQSNSEGFKRTSKLLDEINNLETGEGLLFCPEALIGVEKGISDFSPRYRRLGTKFIKMYTRQRLTADGGQSIIARQSTSTVSTEGQ